MVLHGGRRVRIILIIIYNHFQASKKKERIRFTCKKTANFTLGSVMILHSGRRVRVQGQEIQAFVAAPGNPPVQGQAP